MKKVGYIGNFYKIPEFILHSEFELGFVIVENGHLSDDLLTFLLVREIPFCEVEDGNKLVEELLHSGINQWITCSFGKRIPIEKLNNFEIYNIHYSALPFYKGRHPTFYATMAEELDMGISIHKITPNLDEGTIIAQKKIPYYLWENENDIFNKLTLEVPFLLNKLFHFLSNKDSYETLTNTTGFYFLPVKQQDYTIDIVNDTPSKIYNKVRAQSKYKGALFLWNGVEYWVHKVYFSKTLVPEMLCVKKNNYYIIMEVSEK